jgi:hypothetical protein
MIAILAFSLNAKRKRTMVLLLTLFDNIPSKDWI